MTSWPISWDWRGRARSAPVDELVYLNGSLVPRSEARVSVFDRGFLYGYGLFETMRAYNGRIFRLHSHVERLIASAKIIGIRLDMGIDLGKACEETLRANGLKEARLRLTVSRGEAATFSGESSPTVAVTASRYSPLPAEVYERGYRALVSSHRRFSLSPLSRIKSDNYLPGILARMEAEAAGLDEALLLNEHGHIAEAAMSNIFFVDSDGLVTPPVESGILPGITRQVVMGLARDMGMAVSEEEVNLRDLGRFNEAFLTNSVMEVMPLVLIIEDGLARDIGTGQTGAVTRRLMSAYRRLVEEETG